MKNYFLPYIHLSRLNRPIGIWLLMFPCWWGVLFGVKESDPDLINVIYTLTILFLGAVFMRSGGCTFNDIVDRNIDKNVERTKGRPLASGVLSLSQALALFFVFCLLGLTIFLQLPPKSQISALVGFCLLFVYPFMKRVTNWPQLVLGFAFNTGVFVGWFTQRETLDAVPFILYIGGIFWTLGFDTIYALQDLKDDQKFGIKSTAVLFYPHINAFIKGCYSGLFLCFTLAGWLQGVSFLFYFFLLLPVVITFWYLKELRNLDREVYLRKFKFNQ